jgi:putative transposase
MGLKPLPAPKRTETIRRRITLATNHANWAKKYGTLSADQKFRGVSDHLSATRPGELVLIDHTLIDTYLLFDRRTGLPLGRPWLSMAIDVATRCILGFLVTPEPPSLNTLVTLLKRINRDKTFLAEKYPHVEGHTDSWILPTTVLLDNDWSHLSPSAQDAFADLGMEVIYAPAATPQYKAMIERLFHTFNTMLFHKVAGGIPENIVDRRLSRHNPEDSVNMTIEDIEGLIYEAVILYENERHTGVGGIPARLWKEGIELHGRRFIDDISSLDALLGATAEVSLTRAGVRFKNMKFHDQKNTTRLLDQLVRFEAKRGQSDKTYASGRVRAKIKYNPADCSRIEVWNPSSKQYVTLWNRDAAFSESLSFWAAARIFEYAKSLDLAFKTDEHRALARNRLREHWEAFMPEQRMRNTREARRGLAQEQVALAGDVVVHTAAPSSYEGNAPAEGIAMDLLHQTRLDAGRPPAGVRKNARKADATRARNQKKRQDATTRAARAEIPDEHEEVKRAMFVPGGTKAAVVPTAMPGWGPR